MKGKFRFLLENKRTETKMKKVFSFLLFSRCFHQTNFSFLSMKVLNSIWSGENTKAEESKKKYQQKQHQQLTMDNSNSLSSGTVLLRSVSIFLSNRRTSKQLKDQAQKGEKKKRTKTLSKLDEQMGKLQPKMLEALKRKTHFNK